MSPLSQLQDLVRSQGRALPLDQVAALVAAHERPGLEPAAALQGLERLAEGLIIPAGSPPHLSLARLHHRLYQEWGLRGDEDEYDEPRNSCLDQVLERRRGLPILLAIIQIEVGRRVGLRCEGVGFPGHFMLRPLDLPEAVVVDAFRGGRVIPHDQLRAEFRAQQGADVDDETWAGFLRPVDGHDILWRMNQNLARSWARRQSPEGVLRAIERNRILAPEDRQLAWQRCLVLGEAGRSAEAIAATEDWLITAEDPASVQKASVLLTMLRGRRSRRSVE